MRCGTWATAVACCHRTAATGLLCVLFLGSQVTRSDIVVFFNEVFDALCKLTADSDPNVQSAAHLLDRLVKVPRGMLICPLSALLLLFMAVVVVERWHSHLPSDPPPSVLCMAGYCDSQ